MSEIAAPRILYFDKFSLDFARGCLRAGDQDIELRPKAFEVLKYLAENAGRLVGKQDLYDAIWPNVIVSDDSIAQCIRELRGKLGDDDHSLIKTVSRRGYLLDATVTSSAPPQPVPAAATAHEKLQLAPRAANPGPVFGPRAWVAVVTFFLSVVWGATFLLGGTSLTGLRTVPGEQQLGFQDCETCPEMVVLPAGEFLMGSPVSETGRVDVEGLPRRVVIPKRIAIGKFEVTVDQISAFMVETGMSIGGSCRRLVNPERPPPTWSAPEASLENPGFEITGSHPAVCISWHEAQSYVAWLQRRTGKPYRLPTEAEWEYAARGGTTTRYSFGNEEGALCAFARFADLGSQFGWRDGCYSELAAYGAAPVGSFKSNQWGIFDMHGNVWEWVEDCWTPNPLEVPVDGSAFSRPGNCEIGVIRGGSFSSSSIMVRSAIRSPMRTANHMYNAGLRVALTLSD
jgi:formylglycine-generating enzyme required for sulfatase activity/DNA-binding winged helix-turn-helix (wHTH) protein